MSAWTVSREHIDLMVRAALHGHEYEQHIYHLEPITYREGYIERSGAWEPATEPAEIEAVQGIGWEIVESVTGWGSYTHIIVTTGDIPGAHYLAEIRSGRA